MRAERPSQPFDIRDLNLDIEVEADRYQEPLSSPEMPPPDFLEPEELPF